MRDKKDEEEGWINPFDNLEKSRVLQEARLFHEMPIVPRKCSLVLTKILYLIYQGEQIGTTEATEAFFAMTKLFQCGDVNLRRMVYLTIKEMADLADDVIIVTSSLTKDMTGKEDQYRASAIRALCKITDGTMLQGIERYMKQAIVDRIAGVSSAALVSSLHLCKGNLDVVKRWVNEVQQAVNSKSQIAQYHALGLLYHLKRKDKLAVQKLVTTQMRSPPKSPFAVCLLIRYARTSLQEDPDGDNARAFFDFLESCLRHKSEMVIYEAARAIVHMEDVTPRELGPAISVLQLFLSSPKPVLRFAAVRTLNRVAMTHPLQLTTCNLDMENLITDSNRSIATLAITTLLKTGSESSIERLMKQISSFMGEISDEFKIVVVEAIRSLCIKFPKKHAVMMNFLSGILRDEGGFDYKKAIVDTIVSVIENIAEVRETGLAHLCEFIEDCEYTSLSVRVLHILGIEGPRTPTPSKYIRYIYNRLILENATVRAAAVSALARFGTQNELIRPSVVILLKRCLYDTEDEVRDRAALAVKLLEEVGPSASKYLLNSMAVSIIGLERALLEYLENPDEDGFDIKTVPVEVAQPDAPEPDAFMGGSSSSSTTTTTLDVYAAQLAAVPELEGLGPLFKSCKAVELTEAETEYVVQCVKHVFKEHVVFQFNCTNTLDDQVLENLTVEFEGGEQEVDEDDIIQVAIPELKFEQTATAYVCIPLDCTITSQTFECKLDFTVKDCDPETGDIDEEGYADSYQIEDIDLVLADYMQGVNKPNFKSAWDEMEGEAEAHETFQLGDMNSLEEAVDKIIEFLGMKPCERSDRVDMDKSLHNLYLAGVYAGGNPVLARAKLAFDQGVSLDLDVRSPDEETCALVCSAIA